MEREGLTPIQSAETGGHAVRVGQHVVVFAVGQTYGSDVALVAAQIDLSR